MHTRGHLCNVSCCSTGNCLMTQHCRAPWPTRMRSSFCTRSRSAWTGEWPVGHGFPSRSAWHLGGCCQIWSAFNFQIGASQVCGRRISDRRPSLSKTSAENSRGPSTGISSCVCAPLATSLARSPAVGTSTRAREGQSTTCSAQIAPT